MEKLLALVRRHLGREWLDLTDWLRDENSLGAIEARIVAGDYAGAVTKVEQAALSFAAEIQSSYVTSGRRGAKWLDAKITDKLVRFDANAAQVVARARRNELELVQGFREERWQIARQVTQRAMVEGAGTGINPRRVAQDFRDSIGLTPHQEQHVANYRRALESGDLTNALGRDLRDARNDRRLRRAREAGEELDPAYIDKLVEGYRESYVTHRATTIARTEALRNANEGVGDAINQAIDRGEVDPDLMIKTWHARRAGSRARDQHQAMNEVSARIDEDFVLPDGTRMTRPGDPRGGAEHNANCGCTASTSYASLASAA